MTCSNASRGLAIRWSMASPNLPVMIAVSGSGDTRTIVVTTNNAGYYELHAWLTASATDPNTLTPPPSLSGENDWRKVTDANGAWTVAIRHAGAKTFYLWVNLGGGKCVVSDAITFV